MKVDRVKRFLHIFDEHSNKNTNDHAQKDERGKKTIKEAELAEECWGSYQ